MCVVIKTIMIEIIKTLIITIMIITVIIINDNNFIRYYENDVDLEIEKCNMTCVRKT